VSGLAICLLPVTRLETHYLSHLLHKIMNLNFLNNATVSCIMSTLYTFENFASSNLKFRLSATEKIEIS